MSVMNERRATIPVFLLMAVCSGRSDPQTIADELPSGKQKLFNRSFQSMANPTLTQSDILQAKLLH